MHKADKMVLRENLDHDRYRKNPCGNGMAQAVTRYFEATTSIAESEAEYDEED